MLGAALALLLTGCPEDLEPDGPAIVNGTDEVLVVWTVYDLGTETARTRIEPGNFYRVSEGRPCIDDTVVIAQPSRNGADETVLLRHDPDEQPLCNGERWVFDGQRLTRER